MREIDTLLFELPPLIATYDELTNVLPNTFYQNLDVWFDKSL